MNSVMAVLPFVFGLLAACGIGFYLISLWSARCFLRAERPPLGFAPPVSILKPLCGTDPGRTLGSKLEALGISTEFMAGVLTARQIEGGVHFALGSTLACTRAALDAIGGLGSLVDYLADDFELGARISAAGFRVELADTIVENHIPDYSFRD